MTPVIPSSPAATSMVWTGSDLLRAFEFASRWLDHHRERINALNVFPVPDGDTGTNMSLTLRSSVESARSAGEDASAGDVAGKLAYGALMGARGNSGVILSQILRGFAGAIAGHSTINGLDFCRALDDARQMAYQAVITPVEGTMLSVIRVAAAYATDAANQTSSLASVLEHTLLGARRALEETPQQLDVLRQAGVVDAGGQGVVVMLEGLLRYSQGNTVIAEENNAAPTGATMAFLDDLADIHGEEPFGYCTNFMIFGTHLDFFHLRESIAKMGQSAVIVGDDSLIKVHIHTEHPGEVLEYALRFGSLDQIKIDNMTVQTETLTDQRERARRTQADAHAPAIDGTIGIIAVAAGEGLAAALESMGAHAIVAGGQTMNPSTELLLDAVRRLPVEQILVLPNNKNIILTANQLRSLTDKSVRVIPSRSVPQGLAALACFSRDASLDENADRMTNALASVHSVEITRAVRDVELNGVTVATGDLIGLVDGELIASGADIDAIVTSALETLAAFDPELLTIFVGQDATPEATASIEHLAGEIFPGAEIEIIDGGQPHYPYLIAVE